MSTCFLYIRLKSWSLDFAVAGELVSILVKREVWIFGMRNKFQGLWIITMFWFWAIPSPTMPQSIYSLISTSSSPSDIFDLKAPSSNSRISSNYTKMAGTNTPSLCSWMIEGLCGQQPLLVYDIITQRLYFCSGEFSFCTAFARKLGILGNAWNWFEADTELIRSYQILQVSIAMFSYQVRIFMEDGREFRVSLSFEMRLKRLVGMLRDVCVVDGGMTRMKG